MLLAFVPARAGSRGIPRKNAKPFLGRPLLAWSIDAALQSGVCDRVVVSTDDEEIAALARELGAESPFLRPAALAADDTPTAPAVRHALDSLREYEGWEPDTVLVLEPTSPSRRPEHVRGAAELLRESGADSVASVSAVPHHYVPSKLLRLAEDGSISALDGGHVADMTHRRQDLPVHYAFDGLIFGCAARVVLQEPPTLWGERVVGYVCDPAYAIDLDRPEDWVPAEARVRALLEAESA
jgi:CMP-N-acetylneuraminic acid synthetase